LADLFLEIQEIFLATRVLVAASKDANGAAALRESLDGAFARADGWKQQKTGAVDWIKVFRHLDVVATSLGVEIQVSSRSDLLIRDIVHLRNSLQAAEIDIGVIVVPSDALQRFLPDRTPRFSDAERYIEREFKEAMTYPIIVMAIEHDGVGEALPKRKRIA
jgi:hypothetical protein